MHSSGQDHKTAKGVFFVLGLAVLFLFILSLFQFWACTQVEAMGLKIKLLEKDPDVVLFGPPPCEVALSISSDSIPLLRNNLGFAQKVCIDYDQGFVNISESCGNYQLKKPICLPLSDYTKVGSWVKTEESWRRNLNTHFQGGVDKSKDLFEWEIPVKFPKMVSRIIGEGGPGLKVSGYRRISFSGRSTWEEGVVSTATSRQSKFPSLNMEQESQFTISGTIGSKISVKVDQDSKRHTDLENTLQLRYTGEDDEIIKSIEAGNTALAVRSNLIGYSETVQGLFGIKTTAKIGGWNLTMITSQEKGSTQRSEFKAGAETQKVQIRDYDYLQRTFYYLEQRKFMNNGGHTHNITYQDGFFQGDSIVDIKLFKSNESITKKNLAPFGITYVDPQNKDKDTLYNERPVYRRFEKMDDDAYFVNRAQGWIQLYQSLQTDDILAAYYVILRYYGREDTIGYVPDGIKDSCTASENDTCYILKLIKPETPKPEDFTWEYEWKNVYNLGAKLGTKSIDKEGFKLDIYKGNAGNIQVDKNTQDSTLFLRIFGLDSLDLSGNPNPDGIVDYRQIDFGLGYFIFPQSYPFSPPSGLTYTGNLADTLRERVSSIYSSNDPTQQREDSRYYIYVESSTRKSEYSLGRAPIIEGSEVVTLNGRPLIKGQDYTLVYETGEITFLTPEALSPTANLTVDYEYAPLLMIEKKSMYGMQGEYSLGNLKFGSVAIYKSEKTGEDRPRVGQEPIRNFVWGSNLAYSFTSAPFITRMLDALPFVKTNAISSFNFRGQMAQSIPNPNTQNKAFIDDFEGSLEYTDLGIRRGIWTLSSPPEGKDNNHRCQMWWYNPYDRVRIKDIWPNKEVERTEDMTNVLTLQLFPNKPHRPADTLFDTTRVSSRWNGIMRAFFAGAYDQRRTKFLEIWLNGDKGVLNVDLGEISEDINEDRLLSTEDKEKNGQKDGLLEDIEDTGLDGVFDPEEPGYSAALPDPSGDNWNYSNPHDYSHINGTERNRDDPDRNRIPDTEDINSNSVLDLTNNYFQYSIDLGDTLNEFLADPQDKRGWRLYRIPLNELGNSIGVGKPDWGDIRFARIWLSSSEPTTVQIASIQLVGNRWQNLGISNTSSRQKALPINQPPAEKGEFDIFVINTHENLGYDPPPGVAGILNRQTQVREREQSLVLKYTNLQALQQGSAYRFLYSPEDYTNYQHLQMFVHGPENPANVEFFLRLGQDSTNFYEYHTQLLPGWDEQNDVVIDFEKITALKAYALKNHPASSREPVDTTAGHYRIRGNPTFNRVQWLSVGVKNVDSLRSEPVTGEVWVDELTVTDIRKEKGLAGDFTINAQLADLGNLNFTFGKRDSEYRDLTATKEGYNSSNNYSLNLSGFQLHRFLPYSFGYALPFSFSYSKSLIVPKWQTGSDIILPRELRDKEKTESTSKSMGFSPSFTKPTTNWLLGLTLKRMTTSFSYSTSSGKSLSTPVSKNSSYTMAGGYNLSGIKEISFAPLGWAKTSLLPKSLIQTKFSLLPTSLNFNGNVSRAKSYTVSSVGNVTETFTRNFTGSMSMGASPIKGIPVSYSMTTNRDIHDPQTLKFSFNPKNAKLGIETNFSESFNTNYSPQWFKFLTTRFSFESRYSENSDRTDVNNQQQGTRKVSNSNTRRADLTFNWQSLFGSGGQKKDEKKKASLNPFRLLANLTKRIDPVTGSYQGTENFTRSGLLSRPSLAYRLGFTNDPKVQAMGSAQSTDGISTQEGYTARSGIKLLGTKVNFGYSKNVGETKTSTGDTKSTSTIFPDFDFGWSNFGKIWFLKKLVHTSSYKFDYGKTENKSEKENTGELISQKTSEKFSHLATFSHNWKSGATTALEIRKDYTTEQNLQNPGRNRNANKNYSGSIALNNNYSFTAPQGIKIPFLRKIKFKSTLRLTLNIAQTSIKQKTSVSGQGYNTRQDQSQLSITANSGYSFSQQVEGGFTARWADSNDKITSRKVHTRELGIWLTLRF
jgi:hypothetical protein